MSERDMSQASEEQEKESLEPTEGKAEARSLEEATHEPGSRIEETGDIATAEAIESSIKDLASPREEAAPAAQVEPKLTEKELPEGGQKQKELREHEDLDGVLNGDFGSLIPGQGKLTDPFGKEQSDTGLGGEFGIDVGFDENPELDFSPENPSGEEHPGAGIFVPGRGPGGGVEADGPNVTSADEAEVMEMITAGASESEIAAKERQLQEDALDEHKLIYTSPGGKTAPEPQKTDEENPPPPPPKTSSSSTPEEEGGSDISPPTAEEVERVITKTSGDEISMRDPDSPGSEGTDGSVLPKYADKLEAALEAKRELSHKRKKAGSEVVTDPDPEDPGEELGKEKGRSEE